MNKHFFYGLIVAVLMLITTFYFFERWESSRSNDNSDLNIWSFIGINPINTSRKVQNLETFARLYGYARWFHPSDEAQEIDWNKFAVLGVQKVENVESIAALRDTLYRLFSPVVQGLQIYEAGKPEIFNPNILFSPDPDAKPVVWQHAGVYLNDQSNIYISRRTNKNEVDEKVENAIVVKSLYNPSQLIGKEVKLSGYFRNNKGCAKIFIQPIVSSSNDKKHEAIIIDESHDWKRVEISLTVPKESVGITYGFEIEGDIDVWVDDFELVVNTGREWILADTVNMGFERGQTEGETKPVDDWMTSVMRHTVEVTAGNPYSGKYCLKVYYSGKLFEHMQQFGEITKKSIVNHLICVVLLTLLTNDSATYPQTEIPLLTRLQYELYNISITRSFTPNANLASVVVAWNVLQHFFPYLDVIDTNWNKVLCANDGNIVEKTQHLE